MANRTRTQVETELAEVRTALQDIRKTGQSYTRPGMGVTHASYRDLLDHEKPLMKELRVMSSTGVSHIVDASCGRGGTTEADEWGESAVD